MMRSIAEGRQALLALIVCGAVLGVSLFVRPMWRDEYWALFFSGLGQPLPDTVEAIRRDVHPPLYFVLLHFWRMIIADPIWVRIFNVFVVILGAAAALSLKGRRPSETLTFLFLCATSYWVIFYTAEARMMVLEFVLCGLSVLTIRNVLDDDSTWRGNALVFFAIGVFASSLHYFGALWFSVAGAWTGLALLKRGKVDSFFGWAAASAAAIAPVCGWILWANPLAAADMPGGGLPEEFASSANQFLRGLVVKTMLGNLAALGAAILCLGPLIRRRDPFTLVIFLATCSTVIFAFAIDLFVVPMIKERAFIVMMPAVIYLMAEAIHSVEPHQKRATKLIAAIPAAAIVALPLFSVEYFKDRERNGEVRALIGAYAASCAGEPVIVYNRPTEQSATFPEYYTRTVLDDVAGGRDLDLIDARSLTGEPPASRCPIKALALSLPRGEGSEHVAARQTLRQAGVDLDSLEEVRIAKSRALLYLDREGGAAGRS